MLINILLLIRITALSLGAAAAGVGCYAAYEAAAKADGGYLMVAAPVVALAAALIPAYFDRALHDRQWFRGMILFLVWLPCAATVFYVAAERVHLAKAGGEAQRAALHQVVERAKAELVDANQAKAAATAAANKVRGLDGKACRANCMSIKATEVAAIGRAAQAEAALAASEARAVTEASIKQPEWLQPLALDLAGIVLIGAGFGLGRKPQPVPVQPAEAEPALTPKEVTHYKRLRAEVKKLRLRDRARKTGPHLAVSK